MKRYIRGAGSLPDSEVYFDLFEKYWDSEYYGMVEEAGAIAGNKIAQSIDTNCEFLENKYYASSILGTSTLHLNFMFHGVRMTGISDVQASFGVNVTPQFIYPQLQALDEGTLTQSEVNDSIYKLVDKKIRKSLLNFEHNLLVVDDIERSIEENYPGVEIELFRNGRGYVAKEYVFRLIYEGQQFFEYQFDAFSPLSEERVLRQADRILQKKYHVTLDTLDTLYDNVFTGIISMHHSKSVKASQLKGITQDIMKDLQDQFNAVIKMKLYGNYYAFRVVCESPEVFDAIVESVEEAFSQYPEFDVQVSSEENPYSTTQMREIQEYFKHFG